MLGANAKYDFGLKMTLFIPLNDDLTQPTASRIIGGAGPFDFSGVTNIAAVPLTVKIDTDDAESLTVNLSGASSQSAVTVDELVSALDTTFTNGSIELDASKSAVDDNRLKIETTNTASPPTRIQIYGECAEIAMIGRGFGLKILKSDTLKSIGASPILKDEENFSTTDANGIDTEVLSDGYRKGANLSIVDAAADWELLSLLEGGTYDDTAGTYEAPTSESIKKYFSIEAYYTQYSEGTNKEADLVGYVKSEWRTCKGVVGDKTHERGFADGNYTVSCTSYTDEDGDLNGDVKLTSLTTAAYTALDLENL